VNGSGHSGTAYFDPIEMRGIDVALAREIRTARAIAQELDLTVTRDGEFTRFRLPVLKNYEVVVLE
jgi:hypothetical protein